MSDHAYRQALLGRLQHAYLTSAALPGTSEPMALTTLYKLYHYVNTEGYGDGGPCPLLHEDEPYPALPVIARTGGVWAAQVWHNLYQRHLLGHRMPWNGKRIASEKVWGLLAQRIQSEQYPADLGDDERKAA